MIANGRIKTGEVDETLMQLEQCLYVQSIVDIPGSDSEDHDQGIAGTMEKRQVAYVGRALEDFKKNLIRGRPWSRESIM